MPRCPLCDSKGARVRDCALIPNSQAERLILDLVDKVGIKVVVHPVRVVECPDCHPGRITRHRELVLPLEAEYGKSHVR